MVVKKLLSLDECQKLKEAAHRVIDGWEPEPDYSWFFSSDAEKQRIRGRRMVNTGNKITCSVEEGAVDSHTGIV